VSTPVANLDTLSGHVTFADGPEEFAAAIEGALGVGRRVVDPAEIAPHSWNARVADVLGIVDEVVSGRPVAGSAPGPEG
jgi:hypothetical protein